jgi:hypothetical protein
MQKVLNLVSVDVLSSEGYMSNQETGSYISEILNYFGLYVLRWWRLVHIVAATLDIRAQLVSEFYLKSNFNTDCEFFWCI